MLLYHRVGGGSGLQVDLPVSVFDEQMSLLAGTGRVVGLDVALARLAEGSPVGAGPDPVVVTFDDGTADFADNALPVLEKYKVPATAYLATGFIEDARPFPDEGRPLSWSAVRDAVATGLVTLGSHTHNHSVVDHLSVGELERELDLSVELIGERVGVAAEHFSYPKAVVNTASAARAVRSRFRSAAIAGTRANVYGAADPYRLTRSPVQRCDGLRWFGRKAVGGMRLEGTVRHGYDRLRYARATT